MTDSNLDDLDCRLKPIAEQFLARCNARFKTRITVTYRSTDEQDKAHAAGLSNAVAGQSPHNCRSPDGLAAARGFDWAIFNADGSYVDNGRDPRYAQAGAIVMSLGLVWGGNWKKPDYDHAEMADWKFNISPTLVATTAPQES